MTGSNPQGETSAPTVGNSHTRVSPKALTTLVATVVVLAVISILNLVTVDKVLYRPGPVFNTLGELNGQQIITIDGVETYETSGSLDFTTVSVDGGPGYDVTAMEFLLSKFDDAIASEDYEEVFDDSATQQQVKDQNVELMQVSQEGAAVVALRADGVEVPENIVVAQIIVGAPAEDAVQVDDVILSVGGTEVSTPDDVRDALQEYEPGTVVPVTVLRDDEEVAIDVPTGPDEDDPERTIIGVYLASTFEVPYDITIDAGNVGGPSAGLMFSLALYDTITPGELTGGWRSRGPARFLRRVRSAPSAVSSKVGGCKRSWR
ncbi:PDZ domain-containing protein [Ornithinimicrobium sp. INDO-MA30-4]|uniref:YlbL family protein n=1 Tax=Ornithinimicrobium sp. INDO-MA30-4 TaxID=2908651 RepID=UPI001F3B86A1|nr:PDZ domain-containing protein [Ornithinimicrobium sp. INDO-MA30-4]UJH71527.1 PDZ domain-containing protein [Ornithinimicrobium sp. INDO-MA30-4]